MRKPKHTTAKARSKAAADRMWARKWVNGPEGTSLIRSCMDRVMERVIHEVYGLKVTVDQGRLVA